MRSAGLQPVQARLISDAPEIMKEALAKGDRDLVTKLLHSMTEMHKDAVEDQHRTKLMDVLNHGTQDTEGSGRNKHLKLCQLQAVTVMSRDPSGEQGTVRGGRGVPCSF